MKSRERRRLARRVRDFALCGETTGELDELRLPVRLDWAAEDHGRAHVVYGHTPVAESVWGNRTINIDTGCVFGGRLTAMRWPENELVSVPAQRAYARASRPLLPSEGGGPALSPSDGALAPDHPAPVRAR